MYINHSLQIETVSPVDITSIGKRFKLPSRGLCLCSKYLRVNFYRPLTMYITEIMNEGIDIICAVYIYL